MDVTKFLYEGCLVWTLTTSGYKFLTLNLYRHLQVAKVPWKLAIVCADMPCYRFFLGEGIPCILYTKAQKDSLGKQLIFGTKPFQEINIVKLDILSLFAKNIVIQTCVYMDGDIIVKGDFLPDIRKRLDVTPLLLQCDEVDRTECKKPCKNCCTGFIAWKHGYDQGIFTLNDKALWASMPEDQVWVNTKLKQENVSYDTLPRDLYPNGVFVEINSSYLVLHYNQMVGAAKILKMKKGGNWIIPYL
jgi:hypothetical protein